MLLTVEPRDAEYVIVSACLPGKEPVNIGILLLDPRSGRLSVRLRKDWRDLTEDSDELELFANLEDHLRATAKEGGGRELLLRLEDSLSNVLRLSERRAVAGRDLAAQLNRLFETHVGGRDPVRVIPFVTHLPVYSLRAAAGRFGEDMEVEPETWLALPPNFRPTPDMFVVHVTGRSMEPLIPDGSLAVFRVFGAGTRQGKRVLVWRRGASGQGGEFTVKVYESRKSAAEDEWRHTRIILKPLNRAYDAVVLEPGGEYRVLGEFVRTLP